MLTRPDALLHMAQGVTWMSRPHPDWKPGDKQPNPWGSNNFETLDPAELGAAAYPLVSGVRAQGRNDRLVGRTCCCPSAYEHRWDGSGHAPPL